MALTTVIMASATILTGPVFSEGDLQKELEHIEAPDLTVHQCLKLLKILNVNLPKMYDYQHLYPP